MTREGHLMETPASRGGLTALGVHLTRGHLWGNVGRKETRLLS